MLKRQGTPPRAAQVADPFFAYTTGQVSGASIATSSTATATISIQASHDFQLKHITCQYNRNDWTFSVNLTGLGAQVFDQDIRGALIFGEHDLANGSPSWPRGMAIRPAMTIPANTSVVIKVTNGTTGTLDIYFALIGNRVGALI